MSKLKTEKVYTNILDENIDKNITSSSIWSECYHETDDEKYNTKYVYEIAFNGLKPVQVKSRKENVHN